MKTLLHLLLFLFTGIFSFAQTGWSVCNAPAFGSRVDDIFMVNTQIGYAASGDGKIVKTTDGGESWTLLVQSTGIYYRSVEFINSQKGFVGGFPQLGTTTVLRKTIDGGVREFADSQ